MAFLSRTVTSGREKGMFPKAPIKQKESEHPPVILGITDEPGDELSTQAKLALLAHAMVVNLQ